MVDNQGSEEMKAARSPSAKCETLFIPATRSSMPVSATIKPAIHSIEHLMKVNGVTFLISLAEFSGFSPSLPRTRKFYVCVCV